MLQTLIFLHISILHILYYLHLLHQVISLTWMTDSFRIIIDKIIIIKVNIRIHTITKEYDIIRIFIKKDNIIIRVPPFSRIILSYISWVLYQSVTYLTTNSSILKGFLNVFLVLRWWETNRSISRGRGGGGFCSNTYFLSLLVSHN